MSSVSSASAPTDAPLSWSMLAAQVLVIGTDADHSHGLLRAVSQCARQVDHACTRAAVLRYLTEYHHNFSLIIIDHEFVDDTGWSVLAAAREHRPQIPVLMLTAADDVQQAQRCCDYGASDFLMKSTHYCQLLPMVIARVLRQAETRAISAHLQRRTQELATINAELDQFAAIAAHDLQAPMRLSCLKLDLLHQQAQHRLDDDDQRLLAEAQATLRRSGKMIGRILDYARDTAINLDADQDIDSAEVCRQAIDNLQVLIKQTSAVLDIRLLPQVRCEPTQFLRVMQNLINNSLRYAHPQRRPQITIQGKVMASGFVAIDVSDNGCGINTEQQEDIFKLFQRGKDAPPHAQVGSGIGLAVCRKIIQARGGRLFILESSEQGTTMRLTLPRGMFGGVDR